MFEEVMARSLSKITTAH